MDDQQQAAQTFRETLTKVKQFLSREAPPKLSEADTKAFFVERYIGALGYEGFDEVQREYYVKNSQEFIDYVLRAGGTPVLAIEAKPLLTDLTDKSAAQLVQYCAVEGIEWCALTNARALWLFNAYLKGDQNQKLVVKLDLLGFNTDQEFQAIFEQVWLLSKASLSSPSTINSWMERRRLDQATRAILLNRHSDSVRALVAELTKVAGVAASSDSVVRWVRDQLTPSLSIVPPATVRLIREIPPPRPAAGASQYWLVPCGNSEDGASPIQHLHRWLDRGFWGFYKSTAGRLHIQPGDMVAFYANKVGVVAKARVAGRADALVSPPEWPEPTPPSTDVYKIPLQDIVWLPDPRRPISKETWDLCSRLDAFKGRTADANPGWFVQTTRHLSQHDFDLLVSERAA